MLLPRAVGIGPTLALLHALPPAPRAPPAHSSVAGASLTRLFDFEGAEAASALEAWERIDDVIMGGVSSSRPVLDQSGGGALFEGPPLRGRRLLRAAHAPARLAARPFRRRR